MASADMLASTPRRRVGFLLGLGIFLIPLVFAWFTLRRGCSTLARVLSLGWAGLSMLSLIVAISAPTPGPNTGANPANPNTTTSNTPALKADADRAGKANTGVANTTSSVVDPATRAATVAKLPRISPFRLGDFEVDITSITLRDRVGLPLLYQHAGFLSRLVVVGYTVTNLGAKPMKVPAAIDQPHLIGPDGRSHNRALFKTTALLLEGGYDAEPEAGLAPGVKIRSGVVFEIIRNGLDPKTLSLNYNGGPTFAIK